MVYIKKNEALSMNINGRDVVDYTGKSNFKEMFQQLILNDKAEITKYLDDLAIKLNSQKEQIKNFAEKGIGSKVKLILKDQQFDV